MPILGVQEPGPSAPAHFNLESLIRPNILSLLPYRCARDDYDEGILLDANENALGPALPSVNGDAVDDLDERGTKQEEQIVASTSSPLNGNASKSHEASSSSAVPPDSILNLSQAELASLNRYPSPTHDPLKRLIATLRGVPNERWIFLGVGSDEVIDLLYRVSCVPGKDVVITTPPTYGMYKVTAQVNDVGVQEVPLITEDGRFEVDMQGLSAAFKKHPSAKLLFLCSPGNPTGTLIPLSTIRAIANDPSYRGIIVVDEAYIDFAPEGSSAAELVQEFANVCVMQTLSKGFGLAGIRLGFLLASPPLVQILTNTKAPYNVSKPTAMLALSSLGKSGLSVLRANVRRLNASRETLANDLSRIPDVGRILGGNHANFLLVEILDKPADQGGKADNARALAAYKRMAESMGVVVRFRGNERGCEACLRVTIGTEDECRAVVDRLTTILGESK